MATQRILSHLKAFPRLNRRNLMLSSYSSWRKGVKDLPVKNKMKFNVGGIQAESREGLLKFMETEEGKKKSALWFGWGGTITLGLGEIQFLIWGVMVMGYAFNMALYPWYFRILALSHILSGAGYPRVLPGEGQRKAEHQVNVLQRVWVRPADLQAQCHVQAESGSGTGGIWPTHFVWEVKYKGRFKFLRFYSELILLVSFSTRSPTAPCPAAAAPSSGCRATWSGTGTRTSAAWPSRQTTTGGSRGSKYQKT